MTNTFLYFWLVVFGLLAGSFANVVAMRSPDWGSIVKGRSMCPHCRHSLAWYDLFPLLSFVFLRGRCRYCQDKISWRYPLAELGSAGLFSLAYYLGWVIEGSWYAVAGLALSFLLFFVTVLTDLEEMKIDVVLVVAAGLIAYLGRWAGGSLSPESALLGLLVGAGSLISLTLLWYWLRREVGMGDGDYWLAGAVGLAVGYPLIWVVLLFAVMTGGFLGLLLILFGGKDMRTRLPFGPFLFAGFPVALLWGEAIIKWYGF